MTRLASRLSPLASRLSPLASRRLIFACGLVCASAGSALAQTTFYVHVNPGNAGPQDGATFSTGFTTIEQALNASPSLGNLGDRVEILLAGGFTYVPDGSLRSPSGSTDVRAACFAFQYHPGNATQCLLGGFDPAAGDGQNAVVSGPRSILSGDIGVPDDRSDNCYHVVTVVGPGGAGLDGVCIEGVTIRDGNADAGGAAAPLGRDNLGGGLLVQRTTLDLADVRFRENTATFGGGMGVGGLDDTGITSQGAVVRMKTSRFVLNAATASGGGLYFGTKNLGEQVANCTFRSNRAGADGGGLFVAEHVATFDLVNAVVIENAAAARGGGAFLDARSDPGSTLVQMVNCTVAFNSVGGPQSGAGVYLNRAAGTAPGPGTPQPRALRNTIVHANPEVGTPDNVFAESQLPVDYSNSFIGNLAVNPIPAPNNFILAAAFPGLQPGWVNPAQRNLRLAATSVCIDQGSDLLFPGSDDATDLDLDQDFDEVLPRDFVLTDNLLVGGSGTTREVASNAGTTPPTGNIGVDGGAAANAICDIGAYEHRYVDGGSPVQ